MTNWNPQSLEATMARVEQKVDSLLECAEGHEKRLSKLESWRSWLTGAYVVAAALLTYFMPKIVDHVFKP